MQIEKLGKKALTNPTIVGISIFKLQTRSNPMIKLLLGLVGIILYWAIRNAMKSHCDGLEKPKDPFVGIPLKFLGVKEEWYHSVRCKITALCPDGPILIRFLSKSETVLVRFSVFIHGGGFLRVGMNQLLLPGSFEPLGITSIM